MVRVAGLEEASKIVRVRVLRLGVAFAVVSLAVGLAYATFVAEVGPNELGVVQRRFGLDTGIVDRIHGPGLYLVGPGTSMYTFPREVHVLEASFDQQDSEQKANGNAEVLQAVTRYYHQRDRVLGAAATHRSVEAINVQTSDGYAVMADITLLYSILDPVRVARDFGWGALYVDSFVLNTFRNGVLSTLGKMNAESFYDPVLRVQALRETQGVLQQRFAERGFRVDKLLFRNFRYADAYEKSLRDKKVAVQLTVKNRKEGLVNDQRATLQQIESRGNAAITIAQSQVQTQIARIEAEAELYSSRVHARADTEYNVAIAEAKRLKATALNASGGRYVVALETSKMFDNIDGAVMTPEQYISFVRAAWALIGVAPGGRAPSAAEVGR